MEKKIILSAQHLNIGYQHKKQSETIAQDVHLTFAEANLIALIGANGIGKSTLLRTLTGIQKPLSGEVQLNGKNITGYTPSELAQNLAVVLTESLPPSNLTVFELVALGRQPYTNWLGTLSPEDLDKVNEAISLTQIETIAHKKHFEISDGQLQKVLIARALAQDTPLIVLDEPTTHLDLQHKVNLIRLLKKLASETGKCILYSTHDLDLALQLSDQIVVMTTGNIVQGTPEHLIENRAFDKLFNDSSIRFDIQKGVFVVNGR
ncbi:MAG: ABC transporter ATP-binding protein [Flavobacterium psychrophilum]|nr:MAG: ABC transporter ATP-binding protein [Flavobacterium psychrophilum]